MPPFILKLRVNIHVILARMYCLYTSCCIRVLFLSDMMNFQADKGDLEQLKKCLADEKLKKTQVTHWHVA